MTRRRTLVCLTGLALLLAACTEHDPTSPARRFSAAQKQPTSTIAASGSALLSGYEVVYDGRTFYAGSNQTTFAYTVRASGAAHALSNFVLQLPGCAPSLAGSSPPGGSVGPDPNSGVFGIKWNLSIEPDDSVGRSYSVTFPGNIAEGLVRVAVKASTLVERGVLPGVCGGFDIGGVVFVDQDADGARDAVNEPGVVANVTMALVDPDGSVEMQRTDANGRYLFRRLEGTYTLRIDASTPDDDFNEELAQSFDATTAVTTSVTVGPNSPDNDFGFDPKTQQITSEIDAGIIFTNGQNVRFWAREIRSAQKGSGKSTYTPSTVLGFLHAVEALFFAEPYQFIDGDEFASALAILGDKSRDPLVEVAQELLATELNHVAGLGLVGDPDFQAVLISWGESWLRDRQSAVATASAAGKPSSPDPEIQDIIDLFHSINDQRGGGDSPDPGPGG